MPYKFFQVSVRDSGADEAALNTFLGSHRILSVDRRWVDQGPDSFWSFCVDYHEKTSSADPIRGSKSKGKDYKDPALFDLFGGIVRSFRGSIGCGLPIGSLTSQHFANFYLGWFDRFVKEELRIKGYVRYMDDMVIWSDSKVLLRQIQAEVTDFIGDQLRLEVKRSSFINRSSLGVDFLGCRVFSWGLTLNRRSRVRFCRKLTHLELEHREGRLSERELQQRATSLAAFSQAAGVASWRFRDRVLQRLAVGGHKARTG